MSQPSEKRLAANRANALKSTGPRSEAGKRRVSQNACKHHLYSRKFAMPDEWEQFSLRRAEAVSQDYADPELRAVIFLRMYIRGRQQYFTHLCVIFFQTVEKNGLGWFLSNSNYLNALNRYHANLYAETIRANRLLRLYRQNQNHGRQEAEDFPGRSKPLTLAVGQCLAPTSDPQTSPTPSSPRTSESGSAFPPSRSKPLTPAIGHATSSDSPGRSNPKALAAPARPPPSA